MTLDPLKVSRGITDLPDPSLDPDAATKKYVDDSVGAVSGGLPDPSAEPDGEWLMTSSGAAVWVPAAADLVPIADVGNYFTATDVEGALQELGAGGGGGAVSSVFTRTGAVVAADADYYGVVAAALTGATQASRYAGATTSGAPASGTFSTGDFVIARDGHIYICTAGGSPGTWIDAGAYGGPPSGSAGGDLSGTFPNPTVAKINGTSIPATPATGQAPIATGTTAATWQYPPGHELNYTEITSQVNVTATAEASSTTVISPGAITFDGTAVLLHFSSPAVALPSANSATNFLVISLFEGSTQIGRIATAVLTAGASALGHTLPISEFYRFTPSAGSHTYTIKAHVNSTTGTPNVGAGAGGTGTLLPAFVRFTKA